jgi:hypothetical protein
MLVVDMHEPEGASLDMNILSAPTEGTVSIKLISMAEKATTAEPDALEPRAESIEWSGLEMLPLPLPQKGLGKPRSLLQEALMMGMHRNS